jgi:hypothetical protein
MITVGFGYKMRSGKDTCVAAIVDKYKGQYDIRRYAFADELKKEYVEACKEAGSAYALIQGMRVTHNLPDWVQYHFDAAIDDPICGEWGKQRTLLQWWGTEYRRKDDDLYWVRKLARTLEKDQPQFALVADMRFPNEMKWVKMLGGFTVKITRTGFVVESEHPSEKLLDTYEFDFELFNQGNDINGFKLTAFHFFNFLLEHLSMKPTGAGDASPLRMNC